VEFEHGLLIVVDSNVILDQYQFIDDDVQDALFEKWFVSAEGRDQLAWLETQLANCEKPFKIVAMHAPPISYGRHHSDWLKPGNGRNLTEKRDRLLGLFERTGVQLVLSGHDHFYQHSELTSEDGSQMHFVVGGGGGVPLRDVTGIEETKEFQERFRSEGLDVSLLKVAHAFHFCTVDIRSDELSVQVVEVTDDVDSPTRLIDEITCKKPSIPSGQ
jgi:phosphodiesterase/alkaline phosphatase D-like protein